MYYINHVDFFLIHIDVCAQKSFKRTCPDFDPVTPLKSISSIEDNYSITLVIYLFSVSLYNYKGKLSSFIVKNMFIEIGFKEVWVFKRLFHFFLFSAFSL